MSVPHLILHKVRGSPAFDVAEPFTTEDGEEMWIVSTSGHRAYPWWSYNLQDILNYVKDSWAGGGCRWPTLPPLPDPWPDHYPANSSPAVLTTDALALLQSIGLGPKAIKRRKVE